MKACAHLVLDAAVCTVIEDMAPHARVAFLQALSKDVGIWRLFFFLIKDLSIRVRDNVTGLRIQGNCLASEGSGQRSVMSRASMYKVMVLQVKDLTKFCRPQASAG